MKEVTVLVNVGLMNIKHALQQELRTAITKTVVFICVSTILFPCYMSDKIE
jgi:hypothetical protein